MKPIEFHLNLALTDDLNIMRLHGYIRHRLDNRYVRRSRYQRQRVKRTARQQVQVTKHFKTRGAAWAH